MKHNGGRSGLLILLIKAVFRQNDMNPCFFHGSNLFNGSGQLALQSLQIVDLVLEFRNAQLAVIKDFKTFVAPGQPLSGQIKPCIMHIP